VIDIIVVSLGIGIIERNIRVRMKSTLNIHTYGFLWGSLEGMLEGALDRGLDRYGAYLRRYIGEVEGWALGSRLSPASSCPKF
jgi:hypothetical protein